MSWLLLAHQLPTRASNARVTTWRRLREIGAFPARNAVYVLPNTDRCREDFDRLRAEVVALGGDATVFTAEPVDRVESTRLIDAFRRLRAEDYRRLQRDVNRLLSSARGKRPTTVGRRGRLRRAIRSLRERLGAIERIDFFHAPGREGVATALANLDRALEPSKGSPAAASSELAAVNFRHRRWVTRPRPGVDRMASAWLIRRFIDPKATFAFVERPEENQIPFDMYVGEFTHQGAMCTFETLAHRFGLVHPAVVRLGCIVHDLDFKDGRYGLPETAAVGLLIESIRQRHADDHALLEHGMATFEALARPFAANRT